MKRFWLILVALAILGADAGLKWAVQEHIPLASSSMGGYPYGGVGLFQDFFGVQGALIHATNTGAIWGLFSGFPIVLLVVRLGLIGALVGYVLVKRLGPVVQVALTMIIAGALGNVIDIFLYGHVVDMFYFILWGWSYPVFNLADAAILCGIVALALHSLLVKRGSSSRARIE